MMIPNVRKVIKFMFQTTNQYILANITMGKLKIVKTS